MKREEFAANFQTILEHSDHNLYDVAAALTREIHSVRNYRNGTQTPTVKVILGICNFFNASPNALLRGCYDIRDEFNSEYILSEMVPDEKLLTLINHFYNQALHYDGSGIGKRIRLILEEDAISAGELANAIHFTERTIENILYKSNARFPSIDNLISICQYLNTSPHYLLQDELPRSNEVDLETKLRCLTPTQLRLTYNVFMT